MQSSPCFDSRRKIGSIFQGMEYLLFLYDQYSDQAEADSSSILHRLHETFFRLGASLDDCIFSAMWTIRSDCLLFGETTFLSVIKVVRCGYDNQSADWKIEKYSRSYKQ